MVLLLFLPATALAQADPVALYQQFLDARNRGDAAGAAALFAEDGVFRGGECTPCIGRAAIQREVERRVAEGQRTSAVRSEVRGETATVLVAFTSAEERRAGKEPNVSVAVVGARGGRLGFVSITLAARLLSVLPAQLPRTSAPTALLPATSRPVQNRSAPS